MTIFMIFICFVSGECRSVYNDKYRSLAACQASVVGDGYIVKHLMVGRTDGATIQCLQKTIPVWEQPR